MASGNITKIQRFSLHDGVGVRTTVFLKGCNLRCFWCHNPENIEPGVCIQTYFDRCIGCGECFKICPNKAHKMLDGKHIVDRNLCAKCGKCADNCFANALVKTGYYASVEEVYNEIIKDNEFYKLSNGGMTISGGEPLLQIDFVKELLQKCKDSHIDTAIETAGNVDYSLFEKINDYVDTYLYDIKCMDSDLHKQITGAPNTLILENLKKLDLANKKLVVRMPVMKGVNNSDELIASAGKFLSGLKNLVEVDVLSIHKLASGKYKSLNKDYSRVENCELLSDKELEHILGILKSYNLLAKCN